MVGEEECLYVVGLSGGPKRTRGGAGTWGVVQGIRNPSVFPQDRELRPEEIEGKGLGKELEFPGWGALGGGLSSLQEGLGASGLEGIRAGRRGPD